MSDFGPGPQPEITKEEQGLWQEITDFIKKQDTEGARLGNEGLASTLETVDGIDLKKVRVAVKIVNEVPQIKIITGAENSKGKDQLRKAIVDFIVGKYPAAEIEFD
jgi:hypothetical protein